PPREYDRRMVVRAADDHAGTAGEREATVLHLHRRMRLAAQLAHRLDRLGDPAAVHRVVVAQAATVRVPRQATHAGDQVAVGHEGPALALLAEAEVLEL